MNRGTFFAFKLVFGHGCHDFLLPLLREAHDIQLKSTPALSGSRLRFSQHSTSDEVSWQLGAWKVRATWGRGQRKSSAHLPSVVYPPGNSHIQLPLALVKMIFFLPRWGMLVPRREAFFSVTLIAIF